MSEAIQRGNGVALWRQIEASLTADIAGGLWPPGTRCPTEHALAMRFGVNRHTVRRAIAAMIDAGVVQVQQGRGMFVRESVIDYRVATRTRFGEIMARQRRVATSSLIEVQEVNAPPAVASALGVTVNASVVMLRVLHEADNRPISLSDHWFNANRFPDLAEQFTASGSISGALSAAGVVDYIRRQTRVSVRLPDRREARLLRQPATSPILVTESINVDARDVPVEFGLSRFAGDRVQLVFSPAVANDGVGGDVAIR